MTEAKATVDAAREADAPPFIHVNDLNVVYPGGNHALSDFDIEVSDGEFVCVVGPSGCGKSTLMQVLSGLLEPTTGNVHISGRPVWSGGEYLADDLRIGYVFQDHRLLPWRTVRRNLEIVMDAAGIPKSEWGNRVERTLRILQIEPFIDAWPMRLSGGQRQRVAIGRALVLDPVVMLMDEPYSTLDEVTARTLRQELLDIWEETGKTILFVTHSIREAVFLADRVLIMTPGPGRLLQTFDIDIERPRDYEDVAITEVEQQIIDVALDAWGRSEHDHGHGAA